MYQDDLVTIYHGDCLETPLEGISAIVTDPPYELGFMGKSWDSKGVSFQPETWEKLRSYCKPGAPLLSFGGSRTYHRIACAIEDGGWTLRDCIMWVYGSGFPKSLDISKAIDKMHGLHEQELVPTKQGNTKHDRGVTYATDTHAGYRDISEPKSPEAKLWEGYGTALKPAYEPIALAMNPLNGTFANNALKEGVAGLNIDGCRVEGEYKWRASNSKVEGDIFKNGLFGEAPNPKGRFPANLIHDGSQQVMELFPETGKSGIAIRRNGNASKGIFPVSIAVGSDDVGYNDSGSAARFFYTAKASKRERDAGLEDMPLREGGSLDGGADTRNGNVKTNQPLRANNHPTVKPLVLMKYLITLVTYPEYNLILDPFCGSGSTLVACKQLGIKCIGIEQDEHSFNIACKRVSNV